MDESAHTERPIRILAIAGSLRRASYNRALLDAAQRLTPEGMALSVYDDLASVPLFNEDFAGDRWTPPGVRHVRALVDASDGILIATPAYNQAVPGVLKNLLDWLSQSPPGQGLSGTPVAVTGATPGPWGTRIAQTMLRQMLVSCEAILLPSPALYVRDAAELFDDDLQLTDPDTTRRLEALVTAFGDWIRRLSPVPHECAVPAVAS